MEPIIPISSDVKYWSQDETWPSGRKPIAGEDVYIAPGDNIVLDEVTPVLNLVTVNGRLSFSVDNGTQAINLQANQVYVRAGELLIGNETNPFEGNA